MSGQLTIEEVLKRGVRVVLVPAGVLFISTAVLAIVLLQKSGWAIPALIASPVISFLYLLFAVPRWQIWALTNVDDVHELRMQAVSEGLMFKDGSPITRLFIMSQADKQRLTELESRFSEPYYNRDDLTIADETRIFGTYLGYFHLGSAIACLGVLLAVAGFLDDEVSPYIGIGLTVPGIGLLIARSRLRAAQNSPILVIGNEGIWTRRTGMNSWSVISEEKIESERWGQTSRTLFTFRYPGGVERIQMMDIRILQRQLNHLVYVYRARYDEGKSH